MTIDEFKNSDLRVGKVITAERVEGSEKLLRLQINLGEQEEGDTAEPKLRQVLSGIGRAYTPEEMVGKQVVIIANLDPRMMMGFESQGMLLAASDADGRPVILTAVSDVAPGTKIT
jgi:methionine--tRNA ligase beta chain